MVKRRTVTHSRGRGGYAGVDIGERVPELESVPQTDCQGSASILKLTSLTGMGSRYPVSPSRLDRRLSLPVPWILSPVESCSSRRRTAPSPMCHKRPFAIHADRRRPLDVKPGGWYFARRKRRIRRLILMGSSMERITDNDPAAKDRLMKGLDGFLERNRDRALFGLAPKEVSE